MDSQTRKATLEDEITRLAGDLHAATFRFLTLIGEFDRIGGWSGVGVRSCAHWLTWRCGVGLDVLGKKNTPLSPGEHADLGPATP